MASMDRPRPTDLMSFSWLVLLVALAIGSLLWLTIQTRKRGPFSVDRIVLCATLCVVVGLLSLCGSFMLGRELKMRTIKDRHFLVDQRRILRAIEQHPESKSLDVSRDSEGRAIVVGALPSKAAKQALRRLLIQQGGEDWADICLRATVAVEQLPDAPMGLQKEEANAIGGSAKKKN
jgi:hypothetical protein